MKKGLLSFLNFEIIALLVRWAGRKNRKYFMTDSTVKAVNYTAEMEAAIVAASPLNLESAKALGATMDRTYRSIIAKAKSLGCEYISKPAPLKKPKGETKSDIVSDISALVGGISLDGLEKAPASALSALRANIPIVDVEPSES